MSFLRPNAILRGDWNKIAYTVLQQIRGDCPNVWLGQTKDQKQVVLKAARNDESFNAEVNALNGYLRGHPSFRQLVDVIQDQKIGVYEYLTDNLHNVLYRRPQKKLEEEEVKKVIKVVLKGLVTMHDKNRAHTDIKSDNVVADFDQHGRISRIKVIDLGDSVEIQPTTNHVFSHPTYRAPEALLGLSWTTKVDIWAVGTLAMWGLSGARIFSPVGVAENNEIYLTKVITLQSSYFGPFPPKFAEMSDPQILQGIEGLVESSGGRARYKATLEKYISKEALGFLAKAMKLDPRDRASAQECLQHEWLYGVVDWQGPSNSAEISNPQNLKRY